MFLPLFQIVKAVGLLNSYWGMVLVYPTLTVPFCTWIMIGYFQSIPKELDEAALIDGAGHMQMLTKIFIPVALPGIIAATIFAFTVSWAAFVYPMAFLYSADQQVLTVGTVTSLIRGDVYKWGMLMAGALVAAAPAARDLRVPDGLLHRRPDRGRHERLRFGPWPKYALRNVVKRFDDVDVVRNISLDIPDNEFVVLVGPSGCGKSTTLRMIAGLEEITAGDIYIGGEVVNDLPPKDRDIAMVFQNYALYPHMSVFENMSFGLKLRKFPKEEIRKRVDHAARILDITELLDRKPKALSGGQRQRVAMGRAIVRNPKVFLFDEPLSNLDAKLRVQMRTEIKRVHQMVKTTTVYVTHDQVEAMTLADRVVVMNGGVIEQIATPQDLYHHPKTRFVAGFIGSPAMNFLRCRLEQNGAGLRVRLSDAISLPVPASQSARFQPLTGKELIFGLRPEHITEPRRNDRDLQCEFAATLDVVEPMGMETMVYFTVDGQEVCGRVDPGSATGPGETMRLYADMDRMHLIDPQSGAVL